MVAGAPRGELRLYVVQSGSWTLAQQSGETTISAGQFLLRRSLPLRGFEVTAGTSAQVVGCAADVLGPHAKGPELSGSLTQPEAHLLLTQAALVGDMAETLSRTGTQAARNALLEPVRGLLNQSTDSGEPSP
ncbi:hypothetical protein GCM10010358_68710 [Streptomyces minutiscleroticus]|uniref:Uncharacterized protein n=1 Tax=Streptomyces minutiscleroticus TaxID=68238 RepID=A0A918U7H5_9ACTN|nr:hypothetical protein GCM10010358_68710 [Streptomyces minutiscleroticus]